MPKTNTQGRPATAKRAAARTPGAAKTKHDGNGAVERTTELSEEVLQSVEDGQRAAIEAVHKFIDAIDHTLPALPHGEGPSGRQEIVDSALVMADRLVHTQYEFIRKVVDSAGRALNGPGTAR